MPTFISLDIHRVGYAEQFVANLHGNIPQVLTQLTEEIKNDIAFESPKRTVFLNPKAGDIRLADSFSATPAEQVDEATWEATIRSSVPAKARSLEYGSGIHAGKGEYPITPKAARLLHFYWEHAPEEMGGPSWYSFPRVTHPGVRAFAYIRRTLARWRPAIARRFGDAIKASVVR